MKFCQKITMLLSDVCLSHTPGLSQEQRGLGRPTLAQRYPTSHVTRTPLSGSKDQRSPGCFTHLGLNAWGRYSGDRENVLGVGNYCCCVCSAVRQALGRPRGEERGGGYRVAMCTASHTSDSTEPHKNAYGIKPGVTSQSLRIRTPIF